MLRRGALVLFLVCSISAFAARPVTVSQLEQILTASKTTADASLASQIRDLQLTERLTADHLESLSSQLPGQASRQALQILADTSQFQPLPSADLPPQTAPDAMEQRRIMAGVVAYVSKTIPQLPNFFASRRTIQFEETPQILFATDAIPYQPLHFVAASTETILYRDGHEVVQPGASKANTSALVTSALTTNGVFGPILGLVLLDAAQSTLAWSHWERGDAGNDAVFRFAVPKNKSHYTVDYCCVANPSAAFVSQAGANRSLIAGESSPYHTGISENGFFREVEAYHGEMTVDPSTGAILRIMIQADLKPTEPVVLAGTIVWYGTVEIGSKTYTCPTHSISITRAQSVQVDPVYHAPVALQQQPLKTALSDSTFEGYHVFRADARILTPEEAAATPASAAPVNANPGAETTSSPSTPTATEVAASTNPGTAPATPQQPPQPATASVSAAAAPGEASEDTPEMQFTPSDSLPSASSDASAAGAGFTLHTSTRLVNVEVIALDKKGKPVTDLAPSDFALNDNDRPQAIRFFSSPSPAAAAQPTAAPARAQADFSNQPDVAVSARPAQNSTILLIDSSNLAWDDFTNVRRQALTFFKTLPDTESVGLYALNSHGFQILAEPGTDHANIQRTLTTWVPDAASLAQAQDAQRRNLQQFDFVHSIYDLTAVNGNANRPAESYTSGGADAGLFSSPTDPQLMSLGSSPGRNSLLFLELIARHLAALPGHKNLVWVTSNNVLADNLSQAAARQERGSEHIDSLAASVQQPLNDAHVSLYPLDASQIETAAIGANIGTRNVLAVGFTDRDAATGILGDAASGQTPGRDTARLQQDVKPIEGLYRDLASATGGRALPRASDITGELDNIVRGGDAAYLLSFSPDTQPDNHYHTLSLTVPSRKGIHLQYRTGYLYQKQPNTIRDQFRQALWSAADITELPLQATPVADEKGLLLKVIVGPADLSPVPGGNRWNDFLDLFLVSRDDVRRQAQVQGERIALHLRNETWQQVQKQGLAFDQRLDAPPATGTLRLIAIDERSGKLGTLTIPAAALAQSAKTP
jgi:VWFA-related protein